jgi:hypothetical protein
MAWEGRGVQHAVQLSVSPRLLVWFNEAFKI